MAAPSARALVGLGLVQIFAAAVASSSLQGRTMFGNPFLTHDLVVGFSVGTAFSFLLVALWTWRKS